MSAKLVSVELRNPATSVSLDIPKIDVEKLKTECGFFGSNYTDICLTGAVTLDVPASCTRDSMKAFAVILSRLCDDDDLKRKSTCFLDVALPDHVAEKIIKVLVLQDISVFMGVIRIAQMWNFAKLERSAQNFVTAILVTDHSQKLPMSDEKVCLLVQSFLRDEEWAQLVPNHRSGGPGLIYDVRNVILTLAAAKILGQDDVIDLSIIPALRHVNVEAMRNEPWTASAFELLATKLADVHRKNMHTVEVVVNVMQRRAHFPIMKEVSDVLSPMMEKVILLVVKENEDAE
jgi:hypothetical protein